MKQEVILVLDCGATNVRAIAVNRQGKIVARASTPNASDIAMENNTWHQWSLDAILQRFADCCRQINSELTDCHIRGIAVTTFGVDGALVDKQGNLLYPIISWKCPRTAAVMDNIERLISAQQLQAISGVGAFSFNTLYKLVWLKENHPQLLERAHAWLFISSLINHRLTGEFTTDITMAEPARCWISSNAISVRKFYKPPVFHADSSLVWWKRVNRLVRYRTAPQQCSAYPLAYR